MARADARTVSIIGRPATRWSTFGRADFMRVPLPAARMTTCVSTILRLSRGFRAERAALRVERACRGRRRLERHPKRLVVVQRLEIRIVSSQRAVLGIQGNGPFEMGDRLGELVTLGVSDGEHVERVIVVGVLVSNE